MVRVNKPTLYELVAERDGRRVLVAYTHGHDNRNSLWKALTGRAERTAALVKLTGATDMTYGHRAADGATMGGWAIRWTGRTERDAQTSQLPYVEEVA